MDLGDFFLGPGEGFDRRKGLLAQLLGALDCPAGVRQPGLQAPFAFRRGPVNLGLLPLAARFSALDPGFLAVEALRAQSQPLDGLQRALLQRLDAQAKRSPALIEVLFPLVGLALTLVSQGLAFVGCGLALAVSRAALPYGSPLTVHACQDAPSRLGLLVADLVLYLEG